MLNPGGADNGLIIKYGRAIEFVPSEPAPNPQPQPAQRGKPRTDYARVYCVIPQDATEDRAVEIFLSNWRSGKRTAGGSNDDAGIGDLSNRTAVLYDVTEAGKPALLAWYEANYPGVKVIFS